MKTIVMPVVPQPVLFEGNKWVWGKEEPISPPWVKDENGKKGNGIVMWVSDFEDPGCDLMERYCPIALGKGSKAEMSHDGERWVWVIRLSKRDAEKHAKSRVLDQRGGTDE